MQIVGLIPRQSHSSGQAFLYGEHCPALLIEYPSRQSLQLLDNFLNRSTQEVGTPETVPLHMHPSGQAGFNGSHCSVMGLRIALLRQYKQDATKSAYLSAHPVQIQGIIPEHAQFLGQAGTTHWSPFRTFGGLQSWHLLRKFLL